MSAGHRDFRRLVASTSMETLLEVLFNGPLAIARFGDEDVWFPCPRCQPDEQRDGTAHLVNAWRWSCLKCQTQGTRYELEHLVLCDAQVLDRLVWETTGAQR